MWCIKFNNLPVRALLTYIEDYLAEWIAEYQAKRPGLKVLQQRVDEWLADYDKKEEQVSFWFERRQEFGFTSGDLGSA